MQLYEALKSVPVLQCTILHRYTLMLHYCLCGEHLTLSDINSDALAKPADAPQKPRTTATRSGWQSRDFCRWCARGI